MMSPCSIVILIFIVLFFVCFNGEPLAVKAHEETCAVNLMNFPDVLPLKARVNLLIGFPLIAGARTSYLRDDAARSKRA